MAIETFEFIDDLVAANPTATDNVSEGDDHLRGVKATLKSTFPGITGAVNATQDELNILDGVTSTSTELNLLDGVTATTTELNYVDGVTSSIQTQLGNIDTDLLNDSTPQLGGTLDCNGNAIDFGNWTITETTGVLYFATGGVNKMKLDASGNITVVGDVTAFGTI